MIQEAQMAKIDFLKVKVLVKFKDLLNCKKYNLLLVVLNLMFTLLSIKLINQSLQKKLLTVLLLLLTSLHFFLFCWVITRIHGCHHKGIIFSIFLLTSFFILNRCFLDWLSYNSRQLNSFRILLIWWWRRILLKLWLLHLGIIWIVHWRGLIRLLCLFLINLKLEGM